MTNLNVDVERLANAYDSVRCELLSERTLNGHWVGEAGSSPSATAAAVSALVIAHADGADELVLGGAISPRDEADSEHVLKCGLSELIVESLHWLAQQQNSDGGWGDTLRGRSNVPATLLVQSAYRLTCVPAKYAGLIDGADEYLESQGGVASMRKRFGRDKTLTAPVLANAALAGLIPWRQVPALPFELVALPQSVQRRLQLPVASFAMPLLVAVGLLKFHHDPPRNPITRLWRRLARKRCLAALERMQAEDGSFLEAVPLTAFVVMSLAGIGLEDHPIVTRGVEFLLSVVRSNASWAIDVNLAVSNTALAISALSGVPVRTAVGPLDARTEAVDLPESDQLDENCLDWLLDCQRRRPDQLSCAEPGGWAWNELEGAVPTTDDTASVLSALAAWRTRYPQLKQHRLQLAALGGVEWLLSMQNSDGGWPNYCRGWNALVADASACDLTAKALRALAAWKSVWTLEPPAAPWPSPSTPTLQERLQTAIDAGWRFLEQRQRNDGSFVALRCGNQYHPDGHNLVYGTAVVLSACADLGMLESELAQRAARWLLGVQHANGGWGPPRTSPASSLSNIYRTSVARAEDALAHLCSVEETSLAAAALLPLAGANQLYARAVQNSLKWLGEAVEQGRLRQPAPVGLRYGRMWQCERLYPLVLATRALGQAAAQLAPPRPTVARVG